MDYTTNLNLKKPAGTDNVKISDINENMDTLDTNIKALQDKALTVTEGTWIPTAATGGATFSSANGTYYKIGKLVFVKFAITIASAVSSTEAITISGLPFTAATDAAFPSYYATANAYTDSSHDTTAYGVVARAKSGTATATLRIWVDTGVNQDLRWNGLAAGNLSFSGVYLATE